MRNSEAVSKPFWCPSFQGCSIHKCHIGVWLSEPQQNIVGVQQMGKLYKLTTRPLMVWLREGFLLYMQGENSQKLLEHFRAERESSGLDMASGLDLAMRGAGAEQDTEESKRQRQNQESAQLTQQGCEEKEAEGRKPLSWRKFRVCACGKSQDVSMDPGVYNSYL